MSLYLHYFGHGGISVEYIFYFIFPNLLLPHYVSWKGWFFLFRDTICLILFTIVTTRGRAEETLSLLLSLWPVWVNHLLQVWRHSPVADWVDDAYKEEHWRQLTAIPPPLPTRRQFRRVSLNVRSRRSGLPFPLFHLFSCFPFSQEGLCFVSHLPLFHEVTLFPVGSEFCLFWPWSTLKPMLLEL